MANTYIILYGIFPEELRARIDRFDWNEILAADPHFQRETANPFVFRFETDGKPCGTVFGSEKTLHSHPTPNNALPPVLEKAVSNFFGTRCTLREADRDAGYAIMLYAPKPQHDSAKQINDRKPGSRTERHDDLLGKRIVRTQLDEKGVWYVRSFTCDDGTFEMYSLDCERASDSHYEFKDEAGVKKRLAGPEDGDKTLEELMIRFVAEHGGDALVDAIHPFITAQFHYD